MKMGWPVSNRLSSRRESESWQEKTIGSLNVSVSGEISREAPGQHEGDVEEDRRQHKEVKVRGPDRRARNRPVQVAERGTCRHGGYDEQEWREMGQEHPQGRPRDRLI